MTTSDQPIVQAVRRLRQAVRSVREMVRDTPALSAGFGALVGGLAALSLTSQFGLVLDLFAPSWAIIAGAEFAGAAIGWAKAENRIAWRRLFPDNANKGS